MRYVGAVLYSFLALTLVAADAVTAGAQSEHMAATPIVPKRPVLLSNVAAHPGVDAVVSAADVSAGTFGANAGYGTFTFPGVVKGTSFFTSYTPDGIFGTSASPWSIATPMGGAILLGYADAYGGQYTPSIGFGMRSANYDGDLPVLQTRVTSGVAEASNRWQVSGSGKLSWGNGANPPDVSVERSAANTLRVNGNLVATGSITGATVLGATYQDVAEWVPASADLAPGTVVALNPSTANEVMPSAKAYDTAVAGVVSAAPGVILGVGGAAKEMIATTGRVRVKADATDSPIAIGDLLVTSDLPGTAMKSRPLRFNGRSFHQPGTIIGKALEPLTHGQGEILVLLSLQ